MLRCQIPNPGVPCAKLGGSKVDSAFHPSKVNKMNVKNFWELRGKKETASSSKWHYPCEAVDNKFIKCLIMYTQISVFYLTSFSCNFAWSESEVIFKKDKTIVLFPTAQLLHGRLSSIWRMCILHEMERVSVGVRVNCIKTLSSFNYFCY